VGSVRRHGKGFPAVIYVGLGRGLGKSPYIYRYASTEKTARALEKVRLIRAIA
jgi:hypothetical protein